MYLASGSSNTELRMYLGIISQYLEGNKKRETKELLDQVIKYIHNLLLDEIQGYEVDHSVYNIVIPLHKFLENQSYSQQYFKELDINAIDEKDYETLNGIISSLVSLNDQDDIL